MHDPRTAFEAAGAFLHGHFLYASGRHGADYLEKFRILEDPTATVELAGMIAQKFNRTRPDLVAGPTLGGVLVAYEVARQLGVQAVYAEPGPEGRRVLRRGFKVQAGASVLVVDDVVTTGGSLQDTIACIRSAGGQVIGVGVLADRTQGELVLGVPLFACVTLDFPSYPPEACPLCSAGVPLSGPRGSHPVRATA